MQRGFTLIETLVYLALFSLIIGGLVIAAYGLFESSDRNQTKAMMQEEHNYIMAKIIRALDNAKTITQPLENSSGPTIKVKKYDTTWLTVSTTTTNVFLGSNRLNNSNVSVDKLLFTHVHNASAGVDAVLVDLTMSAKTPTGMTISQSASTTRYIRK